MNEDCECVRRLREIADTRLVEARRLFERELPNRLDAFAAAMKEGAVQLVARRLLRAGAYRAALDRGSGGQVTPQTALAAASRAITQRPRLQEFVTANREALFQQMGMIDPLDFRITVRARKRFREASGGHIVTELDAAERLLKQLDHLEKRLPAWKSYARSAETPHLEIITDIHEGQERE